MRTMIQAELTATGRLLAQLLAVSTLVSVFVSVATQSVATGGVVPAMTLMSYVFSTLAYDEANGWQGFRLTLPISRQNVVVGRYLASLAVAILSALLGAAVACALSAVASTLGADSYLAPLVLTEETRKTIWAVPALSVAAVLVVVDVMFPLSMRSGLTRSVRLVPVVLCLLFVGGGTLVGNDGPLSAAMADIVAMIEGGGFVLPLVVGVVVIALALHLVSMLITVQLYARREL